MLHNSAYLAYLLSSALGSTNIMSNPPNPLNSELEIERNTRLTNTGFFGRIQRKFSAPANNSSNCGYITFRNRRRSKKLTDMEETVRASRSRNISESETGPRKKVSRVDSDAVEAVRIDRIFNVLRKGRNFDEKVTNNSIQPKQINEQHLSASENENNCTKCK